MKEIRKLAGTLYETDREEIENALKRILDLHFTAKKEGYLALEGMEEVQHETYLGKHFLVKAVEIFCDGLSIEKQSELMRNRILAEADIKKQFICLLYKSGIELLAAGERGYYVKQYLCSLFPENCEEAVGAYIDEVLRQQSKNEKEEKERILPGKFRGSVMSLPYEVSKELKQLESLILKKENEQVLRMLMHTDNYDVCSFLMCATENGREKIFANMSARLRLMLMEDVIKRCEALSGNYEEELKNVKTAIIKMQQNLSMNC